MGVYNGLPQRDNLAFPPVKDCEILELFVWQTAPLTCLPLRNPHLERTKSQIAVASLLVDVTEDVPFHTTHEITVRK